MSRGLPALLLCIALTLGGILYLEARPGASGTDAGAPTEGRAAEVVHLGQPAPAENAAPWVATILARPLFSPTRRSPAAEAGSVKAVAEMPRLAGVLVSEAGSEAIFARPGQKPTVVRAGDRIGPYLVTSISAGEVSLAGPTGPVTIHPAFASAAEQPTTPATPAGTPYRPRVAQSPPAGIPSLADVQSMIAKQQAEAPK